MGVVTTAARYADAVPWDFLRTARARSTALAIVLNRVPQEASVEVPQHLAQMLSEAGLQGVPVFTIPEAELPEGRVREGDLAPLRSWLDGVAKDAEARERVVRQTLVGALGSVSGRVDAIAGTLQTQAAEGARLADEVTAAYRGARTEVEEAVRAGHLLRGEVLARWQEVVGTGELMKALESRIAWLRDRIVQAFSGRPAAATQVQAAVGGTLQSLLAGVADSAAERAADAWNRSEAGRGILSEAPARLDRASSGFAVDARDEVRAWQGHVLDLVSAEGASKRTLARVASLGVNVVGASLMIAVFAQTGGLTGGELAIAGGTATVSQRLLEAIFGDQAVRDLTARARRDLLQRVDRLLAVESDRFAVLLRAAAPDDDDAENIRRIAARVRPADL